MKIIFIKNIDAFLYTKEVSALLDGNSKSMTSWFGTLFTKFGKILVSGSTLEAHRHYKIHFGMEIFAVTPSRVCRQNMNAQFMSQKMTYWPFFGLPIQKWAKNHVFDQNFNFRGQIADK